MDPTVVTGLIAGGTTIIVALIGIFNTRAARKEATAAKAAEVEATAAATGLKEKTMAIEAMETAIDSLIKANNDNRLTYEADVKVREGEINALRSKVERCERQKDTLASEVSELRFDNIKLGQKIQTLVYEVAQLKSRLGIADGG